MTDFIIKKLYFFCMIVEHKFSINVETVSSLHEFA